MCRVNPCSARGRVVSQVEEPFSLAKVMALRRLLGRRSVSFIGILRAPFLVCISDGGLGLQLFSDNLIAILTILREDVVPEG